MKKVKLHLLLFLLTVMGACKKELQQQLNSEAGITTTSKYSSTKYGDTIVHKIVINGEATYVNEIKGTYYYAEDMILSAEQFSNLKKMSNLETTARAAVFKDFIRLWPRSVIRYEIPYQHSLSANDNREFAKNIKKAMEMISRKKTVGFLDVKYAIDKSSYITFVYSSRNAAVIGWRRGANDIQIKNWNKPGIIAHEILHTLGFSHEQARTDRENYINIHWENIQPGRENNFNKLFTHSPYGSFDFNSIMMYKSDDLSINGNSWNYPTITRKHGDKWITNQRERLSETDYAALAHFYNPNRIFSGIYNSYRIETALENGGKSLDVKYARGIDGAPIILNDNSGGNNQNFTIRRVTNEPGHVVISSRLNENLVLGYNGGDNQVVLKNYRENDQSQQWRLYNLGNDGFCLAPRNQSNYRIEVQNGSFNNETKIVLRPANENEKKQRFFFVKTN